MNTWNQIPLLRIFIPFLTGIILSILFPEVFNISATFVIILEILVIALALIFNQWPLNYKNRWIFGILLTSVIFLFACNITIPQLINDNKSSEFRNCKATHDTIIATIDEAVSERANSYKVILAVNAVKENGKWENIEGKIMTYFQKDSAASKLKYGDRLIISSSFTEVKSNRNPEEFDYKNYLAMRSIFLQSYVKTGQWAILEINKGNIIKEYALNIREKFLTIFRTFGMNGDEYAVAGALILGYTDKLDQDIISMYSGSGALHILSVSGMHVGIIFIVLNFLLAFLDRYKKGKYFKNILLILLIWFYAAITGLSPAVCRAATMISFIIIGRLMKRNTNIYNTLIVSAIFLLILNPLYITDVGFQLSYIAVFGIILLQKKISELWQPSNWVIKQVWLIISVSLAAQIATFPLSILYFHQFPNYFLITNLIVVPLSNLIIYSGMLVLMISPIGSIAFYFSKVFVLMLNALNSSIRYIESLPYSITKGLSIDITETILLYIIIVFIIAFLFKKKGILLKTALIFSIIFFVSLGIKQYRSFSQKKFFVYNINKSMAIELVSGKNHFLITDSSLQQHPKLLEVHVKNNWIKLRLNEPLIINRKQLSDTIINYPNHTIFIKNNIIRFYDKVIAIVNEYNFQSIASSGLSVDYLILSGNIKTNISNLLHSYKPRLVIIDSSNSMKKTEAWLNECKTIDIPCYAVLKSGAYVYEI